MPKFELLSDRMKYYEQSSPSAGQLLPLIPCLARLDGRAFHTFTKGLNRPFDERLSKLMIETTKFLVKDTNARIGYTQSDEISLIWLENDFDSEVYFDRKIFKMISILASRCTLFFNQNLNNFDLNHKIKDMPVFDCRVWSVPNKIEAANAILWRGLDAIRNSVQMTAQTVYSQKELHKKTTKEIKEMLIEKGLNWDKYPNFFKKGTYIQRKKTFRTFSPEEAKKLPLHHEYYRNPDLRIERTDYIDLDIPLFSEVANAAEVIFDGEQPILKGEI